MMYICKSKIKNFVQNNIIMKSQIKILFSEIRKRKASCISCFLFLSFSGLCLTTTYSQTYFKVSGGNVNIHGNALLKAENVLINNNASININSDNSGLTVFGDVENQSGKTQVFNKGSVRFESANKQKISGSNSVEFNIVELKTEELELNQNIRVNKSLEIEKGTLNLLNNTVYLSVNASILNETNENRIKSEVNGISGQGKIIAEVDLNYGMNINVSGLGIDVNSSTFVGHQIIERHHQELSLNENNVSIKRGFYLPNFGKVSSINYVNIHYFPAELNNKTLDEISVYAIGENNNNIQIETEINSTKNIASMVVDNSKSDYQTQDLSYFTLLDVVNKTEPSIQDVNIDCNSKEFKIDLMLDCQLIGTYFVFDYYNHGNLIQSKIISQNNTIAKGVIHTSLLSEQESEISEVIITQYNAQGNEKDRRLIKTCNCADDDFFVYYGEDDRSIDIRFKTLNKDYYNLEVYGMRGNLIYSEYVFMDEGFNLNKIDASYIANSVYIVKMTNSKKNFSSKIATTNKY